MKLFEVSTFKFRSEVEKLVGQDWSQDPFMPTLSDNVYELDDDDFNDLQYFVDDVVKFAVANNISDPREAIDAVVDAMRQGHNRNITVH